VDCRKGGTKQEGNRLSHFETPSYHSSMQRGRKMVTKTKSLKKHNVRASLQVRELTKAGSSLDLEIYASKQKLGTMIIGRGSLYWFGKGRKTKSKRINWTKFSAMMDKLAYGNKE
jgi:hypothetical protein